MPQAISQFPDNVPDLFPHGLRGILPRASLPAGEVVATADGMRPRLPVGLSMIVDNPHSAGIDAARISTFVDTWISPPPYIASAPRDFTFKAVIGEPSW